MNLIIHELKNYKTAEKQGDRTPFCYNCHANTSPIHLHPLKHVIMLIVHVSTKSIIKIQQAKTTAIRVEVESPTTPTVRAQKVIVPNFYKH